MIALLLFDRSVHAAQLKDKRIGTNGAPLVWRNTRKSWDRLLLAKGDQRHALIKSVALAD